MSKITKKGNHIFVPDHVTIPYIEGDGVGHDIKIFLFVLVSCI